LFLIWRAKLLPEGFEACLLLPLLASAYGFCQVRAKTEDGYFLGFPSYWNLVALYLFLLRPWHPALSVPLIVFFALLTFVPLRYLYPSQRGRLNLWTNLLSLPWAVLLGVALWRSATDADSARVLCLASLYFPMWYLLASWVVSAVVWRRWRGTNLRRQPAIEDEHLPCNERGLA
jgi:phosphatidylcholine synthase